MQNNLPRHTLLILDGNRRWAKAHGLDILMGHSDGKNKANEISETAFSLGVPYVTLWALSEDNIMKRTAAEINFIVSLLKDALKSRLANRLLENQIRFRVVGKWRELLPDKELVSLIDEIESKTKFFEKYNLTILFAYDGEREVVETRSKIIHCIDTSTHFIDLQTIRVEFEKVREASWLGELPPVDLIIRTGEEKEGWTHLSAGCMMLHTANSQIYSSKTLWPDFSKEELEKIVGEFGKIERRFGK